MYIRTLINRHRPRKGHEMTKEPKPKPMSREQFAKAVDVLRYNKPPADVSEDQDIARVRLAVGIVMRKEYPALPDPYIPSPLECSMVLAAAEASDLRQLKQIVENITPVLSVPLDEMTTAH
jgi:hypothetical protein